MKSTGFEDGPRWVLGCMSGTSLDGVDAAEILTDGINVLDFGATVFRPYSQTEEAVLRDVLGMWPDGDAERLAAAHRVIQTAHIEVIGQFERVEMIGFHGQTLNHDPANGRTFQLGDGAALAKAVGKTVVWDMRSADMLAGGQGAPLAPFYHFALAKRAGLTDPAAFVNLGGVGNVSFVDPACQRPEDQAALLAFDTGPANAPINDVMMTAFGAAFDRDGDVAQSGYVDETIVARFFEHPYFAEDPPKSLDRNSFAELAGIAAGMAARDAVATFTAIAAEAVAKSAAHCGTYPAKWFICGGGRRNPALMAELAARVDGEVAAIEELGFDGDMLEAQAFAYLAARSQRDLPLSAPATTGCSHPVSGGVISRP